MQARVKIATHEEQGNTTREEDKSCYFARPTIPEEGEGIFYSSLKPSQFDRYKGPQVFEDS